NNISVLLGTGIGSFQGAVNYPVGTARQSVAGGDFNGDGKQDLAVANVSSNNVSVLLGTGTGSFQAAAEYSSGAFPQSVLVDDFNGDGKQDLAVTNSAGSLSDTVSVLLGTGAGSFQLPLKFPVGDFPVSLAVG